MKVLKFLIFGKKRSERGFTSYITVFDSPDKVYIVEIVRKVFAIDGMSLVFTIAYTNVL